MLNKIARAGTEHLVTRHDREKLNGHKGCVLWFTGLSASGKSTIANLVERELHHLGVHSYFLDGDNLRVCLNAGPSTLKQSHSEQFSKRFGLGFSAEEREENIRRAGSVAKLFCDAGIVVLAAFISPYRRDRDAIRSNFAQGDFIEILVNTEIEVCEKRDPKGLYKLARAGRLSNFTGVQDPYETPLRAELILDAGNKDPHVLADVVITYLQGQKIIPAQRRAKWA